MIRQKCASHRPAWPDRILSVLAGVLILKVTISVLANYHSYFPADFNSEFLRGRERHFVGFYQWAFYTHIISGPVALILGLILITERSRSRFPKWHRHLGRVQVACVLLLVTPSGLWMAGFAAAGPVAAAGLATLAIATALCISLGMVGADAAACRSSPLDVAILPFVMLGRRAQAHWRAGHGHGCGRTVGRPPGDLDELARATHGF